MQVNQSWRWCRREAPESSLIASTPQGTKALLS